MSDTGVKSGVPFRVRLQMYPRLELLTLIVFIPFSALALFSGVSPGIFFIGMSMYVVVPEVNRYRAMGIPLKSWSLDTALAINLVALTLLGIGVSVDAPLTMLAVVLLTDVGIWSFTLLRNRHLTRGDQRNRPQVERRSVAAVFAGITVPVTARLIYLPLVGLGVLGALIAMVFAAVAMAVGGVSFSFVNIFVLVLVIMWMASLASSSFRGWRALGLPAKWWHRHVHIAALVGISLTTGTLILVAQVPEVTDGGAFGGLPTAVTLLSIVILSVSLNVFGVLQSAAVSYILVIPAMATTGIATQSQVSEIKTAIVIAAIVLPLSGLLIWGTYRNATAGNGLRFSGSIFEQDRTYYQLQGAGS